MIRHPKKGGRFALLAALLVSAGCGSNEPTTDPTPPPPMVGWGNATVLGGDGVLIYDFTVDPGHLAQLLATALEEKYVPAQLSVSGEPVGAVGLRFKGAAGTLDPCFEAGRQVCPKVSFKVRFDFVDPTGTFQSLRHLNFHSMIDDPSLMHERLNAKLFTDMGIVAPRVAHAELTINGENKGVFAVVEDVDAVFAQDRFSPGGNGNLYKEAWPVHLDADAYDGALENNPQLRDHSGMVAFAQALGSARAEELAGVLNHFLDIDYLMRYLVLDRAISNYDGFSAFQCDDQGLECSNHNYYWYQMEAQQRFWLVPWDLGDSLVLRTPYDPVPEWDRPPADCNLRFRIDGAVIMPSGCDPVFRGLKGAGRGAYLAAIERLLGVFDLRALWPQLDSWAAEITGAVARDPNTGGLARWRAAVRSLKRDLAALRERIERRRDEVDPTPFALAGPGLTDFEQTTPLEFLLATSSESNQASGAVHDLNRSRAISGGADARLDFELRNDGDSVASGAFTQWTAMTLPMSQPTSIPTLRRIRVRMATDSIRTVRIELLSARYPDPEGGERFGWQVLVGGGPAEFVLEARDLALGDGTRQGPVPLKEILSAVLGLIVSPEARGRNEGGLLPAGRSDVGYVQIDDISIEAD